MLIEVAWRTLTEAGERAWQAVAEGFSAEEWLSRDGLQSLVRLTRPIEPFNRPEFAAPLFGLAGAILGLVLLGVAVSSLATLLIALLALGVMLARVYGVTLELGFAG
jgi:hypothetical protein